MNDDLTPALRETLDAVWQLQLEGSGVDQWVWAKGLSGARLAALERRGLLDSMHRGASFNLSRRYDVGWQLTTKGLVELEADRG